MGVMATEREWRSSSSGEPAYSAGFGSLLTDHHSFRVTFSNTHTPYVDFFFEYKVLDDNDFFD